MSLQFYSASHVKLHKPAKKKSVPTNTSITTNKTIPRNKSNIINYAKSIIRKESNAIRRQIKIINGKFLKVVDIISNMLGKIIVLGIGKSGLVGRKIAATFSSLGIPAIFSHPTELAHGDLGVITPEDIVLLISYSGETEEIKKIIPPIKEIGVKIISITGRKHSYLARKSDVSLILDIKSEACPHNLIPTSSTTATLALGDALALSVGMKKGFKKEDLLAYHPEGIIAKKIKLKVKDIMRKGKMNPVVGEDSTVKQALFVMTKTKLGATSVVNKRRQLIGYFTDGDLRRKLQKDKKILDRKIKDVMTKNPKYIHPERPAIEAAYMMQKYRCDNLPVVDEKNKVIGIIDERDLILAGLA